VELYLVNLNQHVWVSKFATSAGLAQPHRSGYYTDEAWDEWRDCMYRLARINEFIDELRRQ